MQRILQLLADLWRRLHRGRDERRAAKARAHFWSELHAGEREAEVEVRLAPPTGPDRSRILPPREA
jgi:hypothetical protein